MKPIFLAAVLLTASPLFCKAPYVPTDQAQKVKPTTIKVLLQERQNSVLLEVKGAFRVFCPYSNVLLTSSSSPQRDLLSPGEEGIRWGELMPGTYGFRIVPTNNQTTIFVNGLQYKGCMEVYDLGGSLRVINEVDVENYLRSCLATQFFDVKEQEVLNSIAIVARTEAYYLAQKEKQAPWHITAQDSHYTGFATTCQYPALEEAISKTRHAILTYHGKLFPARWTENSAGKTTSLSTVYAKNTPAPQGVSISGMEAERLKSAWSFQMAKQELANLARLASVSQVSLCTEKQSGKVYAVKLGEEDGTTVDFLTLQNAVGKTKLKSNDFTVEVLDQIVRFKGYGEGTGVGLCLHTASLMAKQGLDAKKILSQFFVGTELEKARTLPQEQP